MKWQWKGPLEGGITQSLISNYLTDPYTFVLYYGLGLEEASRDNQNLIWGTLAHLGLEIALKDKKPIPTILPEIVHTITQESKKWSYIDRGTIESIPRMLSLYNESFKHKHDLNTEIQFKIPYRTKLFEVSLMGKVDGLGPNLETGQRVLVEHKCKDSCDFQLFRKEIHTDLQVNIYCFATETYRVIYDNILIPESQWNCPQPLVGERTSTWIERLYNSHKWGKFPVIKNKHEWLNQYLFILLPEEVDLYMKETVNPIIDNICMLYDYCSSDSFDPFNPECYNHLYYKKPLRLFDPSRTSKYQRNYWNHLTGQIPVESLTKTDKIFKELKGQN